MCALHLQCWHALLPSTSTVEARGSAASFLAAVPPRSTCLKCLDAVGRELVHQDRSHRVREKRGDKIWILEAIARDMHMGAIAGVVGGDGDQDRFAAGIGGADVDQMQPMRDPLD